MLREVSLRRALQAARDHRALELEDVVQRANAMRRRLRELTDRSLALGSVHARFVIEPPPGSPHSATSPPAASPTTAPPPDSSPPEERPPPQAPMDAPSPPVTILPPRRPEEGNERLLGVLATRYPEGFTVGQIRELLDEIENRAHSYDLAWSLANTLQRAHVFDVAGSKQGPAGPIRVFRVVRPSGLPAEVR